jgi:hypothetical protein
LTGYANHYTLNIGYEASLPRKVPDGKETEMHPDFIEEMTRARHQALYDDAERSRLMPSSHHRIREAVGRGFLRAGTWLLDR